MTRDGISFDMYHVYISRNFQSSSDFALFNFDRFGFKGKSDAWW